MLWQLLLITYFVLTTIMTLCVLAEGGMELSDINPISIYDNYNVNWFGCIMLTMFHHIAVGPIWAFVYWFYVLCTVGRKDD